MQSVVGFLLTYKLVQCIDPCFICIFSSSNNLIYKCTYIEIEHDIEHQCHVGWMAYRDVIQCPNVPKRHPYNTVWDYKLDISISNGIQSSNKTSMQNSWCELIFELPSRVNVFYITKMKYDTYIKCCWIWSYIILNITVHNYPIGGRRYVHTYSNRLRALSNPKCHFPSLISP